MPVNLTDSADTATKTIDYIKKDPIMQGLATKTPAEVFTWVGTNVTDLATAKELLKRLAVVCSFLMQLEIARRG